MAPGSSLPLCFYQWEWTWARSQMIKLKRAVSPAGHGRLWVNWIYPLVSFYSVKTANDCPSGQRVFLVITALSGLKAYSFSSPLHLTILVMTVVFPVNPSVTGVWVSTLFALRDPHGHFLSFLLSSDSRFSRSRRFWRLRPIRAD